MRGSTTIHDLLMKTTKPDKEGIALSIDLNSMIHSLFNDKHFINSKFCSSPLLYKIVLANLLTKKPSANKVEKFLAERIDSKITEMQLDV